MKRKGFTLVELVTVVAILALLMLLMIPNIMHFANMSKISLEASKKKSLETAAEQYGNDFVNRFQNCTNDSTLDELKNQCSIKPIDLVNGGYLSGDDKDNNIISPETNQPMTGDILLCYNPMSISVYASYIDEDDGYSCMDINVDAKATLNLSKSMGVGYVGGDDVVVGILKSGSFKKNGFSCTSSNSNLATCTLDGTRNMKIKVTSKEVTKEFEEVKLTLKAQTTEGPILEKVFTLKIYSTALTIHKGDDYSVCMNPNESLSFPIISSNVGSMEVSSTDEEILLGYYDRDKSTLNITSNDELGSATVKLRETNGNKEVSVEKVVYSIKAEDDYPEGMLIGSTEVIKLLPNGNEETIVETDNPNIVALVKNGVQDRSLTLKDDREFSLKALGTGEANITIRGSSCGVVTFKIVVRNIYVENHLIELFVNGDSFTTKIVSGSNNTYTCTSQNSNVVSCAVEGSNLILTPGSTASSTSGVDVTVRGSGGGSDTLNVIVKETSISLVDGDGNHVNKVCAERGVGGNSSEVFVRGSNLGNLSVSRIDPSHLATARMGPNNEVLFEGTSTMNTGIANIEINESNSNNKASFDYYIYGLESDKSLIELQTGETTEIKIRAYATGKMRVGIEDPSIVSVSAVGPSEFSYDDDTPNDYIVTIRGSKIGNTNLIITGADCGEMIIPIQVFGHSYSINLEKGDFVDWISDGEYEVSSLSCSTSGEETSCEVTFPKIIVNEHYEIMGFSKERRHDAVGYKEGDTITLSAENDGDTYYANVTEHTKPVCEMKDFAAGSTAGSISYVTLFCLEVDSGLTDKTITVEDFELTNGNLNRIVSVGDGVEVRDSNNLSIGKEYEMGIYSESFNQYNVTLKANAVVDNCGNANDETNLGDFFAADFISEDHWYVGRDNPEDIVAVLYNNKVIKDSDTSIDGIDKDTLPLNKYTLIFYGSGAMKDYSVNRGEQSPWLEDGFQRLISNAIIGEGITTIGTVAFNNMENLTSVKFSEGLITIREDAFSYANLESVVLPSTVKTIEMNAFYYNPNLEVVSLNEGLESVGQTAFIGHGIKELTIPSTVKEIKGRSFAQAIEKMTLSKLEFAPNSVLQMINEQAFANHQVRELSIPRTVRVIGNKSFSVPSYAQSTLESLDFGTNSELIFVNDQAFDYNKLDSLELPDSLEQIGNASFRGTRDGVTRIHVGPKVSIIGSMFVVGSNIREFSVDPANTNFTSMDGILYSKDMKTLVKFPDAYYKTHTSYTVPEGVTVLKDYALYGWYEQHDSNTKFVLNLPSTLEKLTTNLLSAWSNIGEFVCSEINVNSNVYKSEDGVIYSADKTILYKVPPLYDRSTFTIPDTVTKIESAAFESSTLIESVNVPSSVTTIKDLAFYTDTNYGLKNIYLNMDDAVISDSAFKMRNFIGNTQVTRRNVYVKNNNMKLKMETLYKNYLDKITVSIN